MKMACVKMAVDNEKMKDNMTMAYSTNILMKKMIMKTIVQ
jgi:hypothetical protein